MHFVFDNFLEDLVAMKNRFTLLTKHDKKENEIKLPLYYVFDKFLEDLAATKNRLNLLSKHDKKQNETK